MALDPRMVAFVRDNTSGNEVINDDGVNKERKVKDIRRSGWTIASKRSHLFFGEKIKVTRVDVMNVQGVNDRCQQRLLNLGDVQICHAPATIDERDFGVATNKKDFGWKVAEARASPQRRRKIGR